MKIAILCASLVVFLMPTTVCGEAFWKFPELPEPHEYGDILMDRISTKNGVEPVFFSHWSHRVKYTCRVCHWELDFSLRAGETEFTEVDNVNGLYCGRCHDGKIVFGHTKENCHRCHTGRKASDPKRFAKLRYRLQKNRFGNKIDWAKASLSGRIKPVYSMFKPEEKPFGFRKKLLLESEWRNIPPAFFPHREHVAWLDCGNCHPDIFNIHKKTTEHFLMQYILEEKFCGVCHLRVAFPMDNCKRCHPGFTTE